VHSIPNRPLQLRAIQKEPPAYRFPAQAQNMGIQACFPAGSSLTCCSTALRARGKPPRHWPSLGNSSGKPSLTLRGLKLCGASPPTYPPTTTTFCANHFGKIVTSPAVTQTSRSGLIQARLGVIRARMSLPKVYVLLILLGKDHLLALFRDGTPKRLSHLD